MAEEGFLSGLPPLLVHSLPEDPVHEDLWTDMNVIRLGGDQATFEDTGNVIYLDMGLRNAGFWPNRK
jgi:hypothetical protein